MEHTLFFPPLADFSSYVHFLMYCIFPLRFLYLLHLETGCWQQDTEYKWELTGCRVEDVNLVLYLCIYTLFCTPTPFGGLWVESPVYLVGVALHCWSPFT